MKSGYHQLGQNQIRERAGAESNEWVHVLLLRILHSGLALREAVVVPFLQSAGVGIHSDARGPFRVRF
jgi:hypothetical protein